MIVWLVLCVLGCSSPSPDMPALQAPAIPSPVATQPSDCERICQRKNMARATAPEIIAADCRQWCEDNATLSRQPINP